MRPYAILKLANLHIAYFDHKEEWQDAVGKLELQQIPNIPLKYHTGSKQYTAPEVRR